MIENRDLYTFFESRRDQIESLLSKLNTEIMWERLGEKTAFRISLVYSQNVLITDSEQKLEQLKSWAIEAIILFYKVMLEQNESIQQNQHTVASDIQ